MAQQYWLLLYAFFPPLFFRFSCLIFFSFWTSSRLHFGGKVFRKAFRILGLDERKSGWVVEQDFHGNFQVNVIWLQCYIGLPEPKSSLIRANSFSSGFLLKRLKYLFINQRVNEHANGFNPCLGLCLVVSIIQI